MRPDPMSDIGKANTEALARLAGSGRGNAVFDGQIKRPSDPGRPDVNFDLAD